MAVANWVVLEKTISIIIAPMCVFASNRKRCQARAVIFPSLLPYAYTRSSTPGLLAQHSMLKRKKLLLSCGFTVFGLFFAQSATAQTLP
jgi:hypothetical protein